MTAEVSPGNEFEFAQSMAGDGSPPVPLPEVPLGGVPLDGVPLDGVPLDGEQRANRLARRFELLSQTAAELLSGDDTQAMIDRLCRRVMEHLDCEVFLNFLLDRDTGKLRLNACAGVAEHDLAKVRSLDPQTAICGLVLQSGQRVVAQNVAESADSRFEMIRSLGVRGYGCFPLLARGRSIGTLSFGTRTQARFSEDELSVMAAVASQVAMAMERIVLLEDARRQTAELEKANSAKDSFLAMLSHELRTPLTPVLLTASMLEQRPDLPAEVRADLMMIRHNVLLEARIIDDLLDLTHLSQGRLECHFRPVDVHALVRAALDVCGQGDGATAELELRARPSRVRGDAGRLAQVLWNLIYNARKYTPPGGRITVRTTLVCGDDRAPMSLLQVDVIDTGEGIDPAMLDRIFDAFGPNERRVGGLGLGLAIARAIAQAHGGSLEARSTGRGHGSTFTLRLPLCQDAAVAAPKPPVSDTETHGSHPASPLNSLPLNRLPLDGFPLDALPLDGAPFDGSLRILLVEDHNATLWILEKLLSNMGHQVHPTSSVATALRATQASRFDIVISDLGLPDGSGNDLMRFLRDRYGLPGIALSGFGTEEDKLRSIESGFVEHITKPVDIHRLEEAVKQAGRRKPAPPVLNA